MKKISIRRRQDAEALNKPFINESPRVKPQSPAPSGVTVTAVPVNEDLIRRANSLRDGEFPDKVQTKIEGAQEFFLEEITPLLVGMSNGLQNANDILKAAFDSEADVDGLFSTLEDLVNKAVFIKMMTFVQGYVELNEDEAKLHTLFYLLKENNGNASVEKLLRQMLKVPNVSGSTKKPSV